MAQRVLQQTREAAIVQERHATILRRLSTFLADASIAFDAAGSLQEMLQLVAEHARELLGARWCDVRLSSEDMGPLALEAAAGSDTAPRLDPHRFAALYHTMRPEGGPLRMTATELARQPAQETLEQGKMRTQPVRGWLAASLARLDGEVLGLVQLFDKQDGDFSELDEAVLVQLAQMSSAAVERARLYRSAE
jgi:GAF domain-containing protein